MVLIGLLRQQGYRIGSADATGAVERQLTSVTSERGSSALLSPVGLVLAHRRNAVDLAQCIERANTDAAVDDHETRMALDAVEARCNQCPHDLIQPSSLRRVDADRDINLV